MLLVERCHVIRKYNVLIGTATYEQIQLWILDLSHWVWTDTLYHAYLRQNFV